MTESETSDAHVQKLKLAMAWNKYDLVVSDIFNESEKIQWTASYNMRFEFLIRNSFK
jgi:hypothetical protein